MGYLLYNTTALFHCFMTAVPALLGNLLGRLFPRAPAKEDCEYGD